MSILTNWYKNKPWTRPIVLMVVGAALGAGGQAYLAPILLPLINEALCDGKPGCSMNMPNVPEIPQKPEEQKEKICIKTPEGIEICK